MPAIGSKAHIADAHSNVCLRPKVDINDANVQPTSDRYRKISTIVESGTVNKVERRTHMTTNTVKLHRVVRTTPERVYRVFLDADAMAQWLPLNGFTCKVHHMDAKVGGAYKMSFTNFATGKSHSFGGEFLELVPDERIRYTDKFDDANLPGAMETSITLRKVSVGTELSIVQEGLPDIIPLKAC